MKNENNKLRQQIIENQKKADQQRGSHSHKLVGENDELKRRYIKLTQIFLSHLNQVVILSAI
jgi:hypothetical protein